MHVLTLYERLFWPQQRKRLCIRELPGLFLDIVFIYEVLFSFSKPSRGGYETNNKSDKTNIKPQTIGNSFYHILFQINIE